MMWWLDDVDEDDGMCTTMYHIMTHHHHTMTFVDVTLTWGDGGGGRRAYIGPYRMVVPS